MAVKPFAGLRLEMWAVRADCMVVTISMHNAGAAMAEGLAVSTVIWWCCSAGSRAHNGRSEHAQQACR